MAKSKLQGITLEIGGDTTALSKALKNQIPKHMNYRENLKQ